METISGDGCRLGLLAAMTVIVVVRMTVKVVRMTMKVVLNVTVTVTV